MKYFKLLNVLVVPLLLVAPLFANAETVLRISDSVSLAVDQTVHGDFYGLTASPGPISLSGMIEGDAYVVGGTVTANGSIAEDLFAIGGNAQVHASVTDDVRIIAGEVTIADYVGGDVFVIGGTLTILSSAHIDGDVFFYGGDAEINGVVGGSVLGSSDALRVDGPVAGDIDVKTTRALVIGDRADVSGSIRYESRNEIVRAQDAVVVGDIIKNSPQQHTTNPRDVAIPFLVYAFTVLAVYAVFRSKLNILMDVSLKSYTRNGFIGLAGMLVFPLVTIVLLATVVGALMGVLALLALLFLYVLSFILSAIYMGVLLQKFIHKTTHITLLWTMVGIVILELIVLVPFIGPLLLLTLSAIMFGALLFSIYEQVMNGEA